MYSGKAFMFSVAVFASLIIIGILISEIMDIRDPSTPQDKADNRIHRVEVDGQECMVLTQFNGKIIALDCDWGE